MTRILGQQSALQLLEQALASGRMHHAWIFSGPRGVGKRTTAVELAKILLDPQFNTRNGSHSFDDIDDSRDIARRIDRRLHPDLHLIHKELALYSDNPILRDRRLRNIPLDLLREHVLGGRTSDDREHQGAAYRTAVMGHGKVIIIDEAELLDQWSQNAMLKTLEEPPRDTYLFLITNQPERLLPTIRSRCQHVRFQLLDRGAMEQWFAAAQLDVGKQEREWIAAFCEGSPGVAQLAAEYGMYGWHQRVLPLLDELARGGYPAELGALLAEFVDEFAVTWTKRFANASKDIANKDGVNHVLNLLAADVRQRLRSMCEDDDAAYAYHRVVRMLCDSQEQMHRNVNLKLVLENVAAQWAGIIGRSAAVAS